MIASPGRDLSAWGLGKPGRPYLIAEAGSNHDGQLSVALELVDVAGQTGCDAVKFQLFRAEGLYPVNVGVVDTPAGPADFNRLLASLEFDRDWIPALRERCEQHGIDLLFSPFDEAAVDDCIAAGSPALKMASPELSHLPLLRASARHGLPLLASTGMATLGDIEEALAVIRDGGDPPVALLQCTTAYPCPEADVNLGAMVTLEAAFDVPVGLSDHTLDPLAAPAVATALGAALIEKHITLGRDRDGPDHPFAIEPDELAQLVSVVAKVAASDDPRAAVDEQFGDARVMSLIGSSRKQVSPSEAGLAAVDRRALHAMGDLVAGHVVAASDVGVLRGEGNLRPGMHPREFDRIVGARLTRAVALGDGFVWDDFLDRQP